MAEFLRPEKRGRSVPSLCVYLRVLDPRRRLRSGERAKKQWPSCPLLRGVNWNPNKRTMYVAHTTHTQMSLGSRSVGLALAIEGATRADKNVRGKVEEEGVRLQQTTRGEGERGATTMDRRGKHEKEE